jgi:cell division protein FtsB
MGKRGGDPRLVPKLARENAVQAASLCCLLLLSGLAIVGPSGVLAWGENRRLLGQHEQEIRQLTAQRDELNNRVTLLDPHHVDPDLVGELVRSKLMVVHPDEMVLLLHKSPS